MKAKKENKVYNIDATQKQAYLKEGYDIYDDNGNIIEYSPKKTVSYDEYAKLIKQIEELKANDKLTKQVEELKKANSELTSEKEELIKANSELTSEKEELIKANSELTKQVEELTKTIEKLKK